MLLTSNSKVRNEMTKTKDNTFTLTLDDKRIDRIAAIVTASDNNKTFANFDIALDEIVTRGIRSVEHTLEHSAKAKAKNDTINALLKAATAEEIAAKIAELRERTTKK